MNLTFPRVIQVALLLTVTSQGRWREPLKPSIIPVGRLTLSASMASRELTLSGRIRGAAVDAVTRYLRNGDQG
ncbi:Uncharacterised protein (plasmid) [Klebsiella aerogenes]|nr:Uncharacterised protein [Klebsiella aerogenes]